MTSECDKSAAATARIAKLFVDRLDEPDAAAAADRLRRSRLQIVVGPEALESETLQLTAAAAIATGARAFPAGVITALPADGPNRLASGAGSLSEVLATAGARPGRLEPNTPTAVIGEVDERDLAAVADAAHVVRFIPRGWSGGVTPMGHGAPPMAPGHLGGAIAAGLGICELFHATHGLRALAGQRRMGLSLWDPEIPWDDAQAIGPQLQQLPRELWLLGLGHLGQALAWLLRLLPWSDPAAALIFLQDDDVAKKENTTTSLLTGERQLLRPKTRVVAQALEEAGLRTRMVERRYGKGQVRQATEPACAVAGFDSREARQPLEDGGWLHLLDAGVGASAHSFTQLTLHRIGGSRSSREIFKVDNPDRRAERLVERVPAYRDRAERDGHACGAIQIAEQAVGTSFVGLVTAAVTLAELLRPLHDGFSSAVITVDLREPDEVAYARAEELADGVASVTDARVPRETALASP